LDAGDVADAVNENSRNFYGWNSVPTDRNLRLRVLF
jgi:hypothetical protein